MPLPPLEQQQPLGPALGQDELALGGAEVEDLPGAQRLVEVAGDEAVGMDGDGELEQAVVAVLGAGRRVGPGPADAVDVDADAEELAGAEAGEGGVRAQREGDAPRGLALDRRRPARGRRGA